MPRPSLFFRYALLICSLFVCRSGVYADNSGFDFHDSVEIVEGRQAKEAGAVFRDESSIRVSATAVDFVLNNEPDCGSNAQRIEKTGLGSKSGTAANAPPSARFFGELLSTVVTATLSESLGILGGRVGRALEPVLKKSKLARLDVNLVAKEIEEIVTAIPSSQRTFGVLVGRVKAWTLCIQVRIDLIWTIYISLKEIRF